MLHSLLGGRVVRVLLGRELRGPQGRTSMSYYINAIGMYELCILGLYIGLYIFPRVWEFVLVLVLCVVVFLLV